MSTLADITDLCTVFNGPPIDKYAPDTPYIFMSKVSDTTQSVSHQGFLEKLARISITVVGNNTDVDQAVIEEIKNTITNEIVVEDCLKIYAWDGFIVSDIVEDTESPVLFNAKDRQYLVKDYLFTYKALNG